jgi:CheY-like chemotaxis protein
MSAAATIVLGEDDEDDFLITTLAFQKAGIGAPVLRAKDGEEVMDLLRRRGGPAGAPLLVLLDLRLPKKSGWEVLRELKSDARLRRVPVVVLTSSASEEDVARAYDLGCNSFIKKPMGMDEYAAFAGAIKEYWLKLAEIPRAG